MILRHSTDPCFHRNASKQLNPANVVYTSCLFSHSNNSIIEYTLNDETTIVNKWVDTHKLTLNVKTTMYIVKGSHSKLAYMTPIKLDIPGEEIESVISIKYIFEFD